MSDFLLRLLPIEPTFVPERSCIALAELQLRAMLPQADWVTSDVSETIEFVDAGANWDGVLCPACGSDAAPWWADAMSEAAETQFRSLAVRARCCNKPVSLAKMRYGWPSAFSRFKFEALNPGVQGLSEPQLEQLGSMLGCPLLEVKAHL